MRHLEHSHRQIIVTLIPLSEWTPSTFLKDYIHDVRIYMPVFRRKETLLGKRIMFLHIPYYLETVLSHICLDVSVCLYGVPSTSIPSTEDISRVTSYSMVSSLGSIKLSPIIYVAHCGTEQWREYIRRSVFIFRIKKECVYFQNKKMWRSREGRCHVKTMMSTKFDERLI